MKKKVLLILPCIAAVAIATFVGKKTFESNAFEGKGLFLQNVEALTAGEDENYGYFVHHGKYYDPVTNLETKKCIAYSYYGPNGRCSMAHSHGASDCCSVNC